MNIMYDYVTDMEGQGGSKNVWERYIEKEREGRESTVILTLKDDTLALAWGQPALTSAVTVAL